eukprot:gene13662-17439_t
MTDQILRIGLLKELRDSKKWAAASVSKKSVNSSEGGQQ